MLVIILVMILYWVLHSPMGLKFFKKVVFLYLGMRQVELVSLSMVKVINIEVPKSKRRGLVVSDYFWCMKGCISFGIGALERLNDKMTFLISSILEMESRRGWLEILMDLKLRGLIGIYV